MSDTISQISGGLKEAAGTIIKETIGQVTGNTELKRQQEKTQEIQKKAEENNRTFEEQSKLESLRKQLHSQMTAPRATAPPEDARISEQEDKVGTNEQMQQLGDTSGQTGNSLPPLAQPSMRHGERLKIRE